MLLPCWLQARQNAPHEPPPDSDCCLLPASSPAAPALASSGQGQRQPKAAAAAGQPERSHYCAKELFAASCCRRGCRHADRLLCEGLPRGAEALPINGDTWQVMRLSRNRNWGHPDMVALLSGCRRGHTRIPDGRASWSATCPTAWRPDDVRPRQPPVGLDADVWPTPMPDHRLSREEREDMSR